MLRKAPNEAYGKDKRAELHSGTLRILYRRRNEEATLVPAALLNSDGSYPNRHPVVLMLV